MISGGDPVEVKGNDFVVGTDDLIATRVEFKGNRFDDNDGDHAEIEGFVNEFVSITNFKVGVTPVTTIPGTTVYEGGSAADVGDNLKVEVEGEFVDSVLNVTHVEIKRATTVRLTAQVDSTNGSSFVMLGVTVNTEQGKTRFEDKTGLEGDNFDVSHINTDDYVEVRGQGFPADDGTTIEVFALIVERDDFDTEVIIQGFIETGGITRPTTITVLDVTIEIDDTTTVFRNDDESEIEDPDEFWRRISAGSLIKAKGTEDMAQPRTLIAEEVEIQVE
jgi:hypothetical protein